MQAFLDFYQQLPYHIDPVAFRLGPFSLTWYALTYVVAVLVIYWLLVYRLKKGEASYHSELVIDFLFYALLGVLVGGRLGYVLFYNLPFYLAHPAAVISPFSESGQLIGIYGMSYHGGLLGVILSGWLFTRKQKINFWQWADFVIPAIPAGYFFGRLGNFLNGELYGRATSAVWGMHFPGDPSGLLRHPSQLYEALGEGLLLFIILWAWRNRRRFPGQLLLIYLAGYGSVRFLLEFFREPDPQIGLIFGFFSLGQLFSLSMAIFSLSAFVIWRKKNYNE